MVQDVVRQGISPATGSEVGNQAVTDFNLRVDGALNIPSGEENTLNGAKDRDGYVRLNLNSEGNLVFNSYADGKWTEYVTVLDGLKSVGGITLDGDEVTVVAPVKWRINSVNYEKDTNTVLTVSSATDGFKRIDYIYADTNNNILLIEGTEVADGNPYIPPTLPVNTIMVAPVYISGDTVQQPLPDFSQFLTKSQADELYIQASPLIAQQKEIYLQRTAGGNDTMRYTGGGFIFYFKDNEQASVTFGNNTFLISSVSPIRLFGNEIIQRQSDDAKVLFEGDAIPTAGGEVTGKITGSELFPITDPKDYVQAGNLPNIDDELLDIAVLKSKDATAILNKTTFSTIPSTWINTSSWTISGGGLQSTAAGIGNAIFLNNQYNIEQRKTSVKLIMQSDTNFALVYKPKEPMYQVAGTVVAVDAVNSKLIIYETWGGSPSLPAVRAEITIPTIVAGRMYLLELEKNYRTNILTLTDCLTSTITTVQTSSTEDYLGTPNEVYGGGFGHDMAGLMHISGTTPTIIDFQVKTKNPTPLVCIFGDSITEEYGATLGFGYGSLLNSVLDGRIVISGRGGGQIDAVIEKVTTEAAFLRPKYVMVTIGTNGGNTIPKLQQLVSAIKAIGSVPIINCVPAAASGNHIITNQDILSLGERSVRFDIATSLNNNPNDGVDTSKYIPDNLHPNDLGHLSMFNRISIDVPELLAFTHNVLLGKSVDSGEKLQVNGQAIVSTAPTEPEGVLRLADVGTSLIPIELGGETLQSITERGDTTTLGAVFGGTIRGQNQTSGNGLDLYTYTPITVIQANDYGLTIVKTLGINSYGGNVLIGTLVDDGSNQLQVNGNIRSSGLSGTGTRPVSAAPDGTLVIANPDTTAGTTLNSTLNSLALTARGYYNYIGSGAAMWTLPSVSGITGRFYRIYNKAADGVSTLTLDASGSETFFRGGTQTLTIDLAYGENLTIQCDGSEWNVYN